jgi:cytochrome P450
MWKHARAMLRPVFARDKVSRLHIVETHVQHLIEHLKRDGQTGFVDIQQLFQSYIMDTATELLFGESLGTMTDKDKILATADRPVSSSYLSHMIDYMSKVSRGHCSNN